MALPFPGKSADTSLSAACAHELQQAIGHSTPQFFDEIVLGQKITDCTKKTVRSRTILWNCSGQWWIKELSRFQVFTSTGMAMAFVRADLLPIAFSSLRQAQENQTDAIKDAPRHGESAMALTSMVNIYCPACHISSPRELRELVQARTFCTVCGVPLNKSEVEAALARRIEPSATRPDNIDGQSVSLQRTAQRSSDGSKE